MTIPSISTELFDAAMECIAEMHASMDREHILTRATQCASRLTGAAACFCFTREADGADLLFHSGVYPDTCRTEGKRIRPGQGIVGWVAQHGESLLLEAATTDPRYDPAIDSCAGLPSSAILAVPIRCRNQTIGVFELIDKPNNKPFRREDAHLISRFADQVGLALDNAGEQRAASQPSPAPVYFPENDPNAMKERAIERMSVGIAHNFNNILNAIIGFSEIILLDTQEESVRKGVQGIRNACNSALDLVNQLEAFTERPQPNKKPVNIRKLIKQTAKLFRLRLSGLVNIQLELDDTEILLLGDSARLHRAIMNLLKNARESLGGKPGDVRIHYEALDITTAGPHPDVHLKPGTYAKLVVQDSGCGMRQETLDQIYDPYFTTKKGGIGTGIGLTIANRIFREHGGEISVVSNPGSGTTFSVFLPKTIADKAAAEKKQPLPRGKEKVLVVDDEELFSSILAKMLSILGYQVTKVNSSKEALSVYQQSPQDINLVITDWAMPEITGDRLAEMLIKINPATRVILCSAFDEGVDFEKLAARGIREILKKPVDMNKLAAVVRKVLDGAG